MNPYEAYNKARSRRFPCDETRRAACKCPYYAYSYALYVDERPREDTREAACENSYYAYLYARDVDNLSPPDWTPYLQHYRLVLRRDPQVPHSRTREGGENLRNIRTADLKVASEGA